MRRSECQTLALLAPEGMAFVRIAEIAYAKKSGDVAAVTLMDGSKLLSYESFEDVRKALAPCGMFIQVQRAAIANISAAASIAPLSGPNFLLGFKGRAPGIELNAAYAEGVKKRLGLRTLEHVEPFDRPTYWLMREGVRFFARPIHLMPREELLANFADSAGNPVISLLIANFLYQFAANIRTGAAKPLEGGNVRSLWYMIKPAISRLGALEGSDHYKTLSEVMARLVSHKIVTYKEYGLGEEENWAIGKTRPAVILLAEKRSHFRFIKGFNEQYGVSVLAAGGIPGMITMEFFTDAFKKAIPQIHLKEILVITLTDYDPSGDLIISTFLDNLKTYNIPRTKFVRLVSPANFTPDEVEGYKYALVGDDEATPTMVRKWLKKTGGINGQAFGLETDALMITPARVRELFLGAAGDSL